MKIGIIGAMKEEIQYFKEQTIDLRTEVIGKKEFLVGSWQDHEVVISQSGVGKVNGAITSQMMIDVFKVEAIIFTGVAGAMNPSLEIGDVVISTSCQQHDIDASSLGFAKGTIPMSGGPSDFVADENLVGKAYESAKEVLKEKNKVIKGKILSGDQFISNKEEVRELRDMFHGDCVEMEGAAVAHVSYTSNIPYVIIRSISDKANGDAPSNFESFVTESAKKSAEIVERVISSIQP
ncbi:5'-methylthioadenosine/adenosylhomocysteine nucleosidase [Bacillus shivajii]|uniref:5'-methylthioadenosine/adenosylhomocysteine nucleosidase n=1 Tax=Bacillus shivajii TaxID=1983719 RepID=UPI001CFA85FF|nr:5'-methylthioadenosine/adenosylhomocysteine nucleosidase [Bacillus shivajii]UCZ52306.1 5'-methylthioadenosine/adenosylhomocysteine nucleosidase [Bacillus shivajii]